MISPRVATTTFAVWVIYLIFCTHHLPYSSIFSNLPHVLCLSSTSCFSPSCDCVLAGKCQISYPESVSGSSHFRYISFPLVPIPHESFYVLEISHFCLLSWHQKFSHPFKVSFSFRALAMVCTTQQYRFHRTFPSTSFPHLHVII